MSRLAILASAALIGAAGVLTPSPAAAAPCESLGALSLPDTTITAAQAVPAGAFQGISGLPAFCRVTASVRRPGASDVKIEVWMPVEAWTGDFQPAASGFAGGTITYAEMGRLLQRGAATANTNRGHDEAGSWKPADMAPLPYHLMVARAKAIVARYYGRAAGFAVMNECGGGGSRDALQEVQNWPADLDAAAASGIVYYATHHGIAHMWVYQATHKDEASYIPPAKYRVVHEAALAACDANDGLRDGIIEDPPHCAFDPGVLLCRTGDAADCLTAPQVEAVRKIYTAPVHARTGQYIYAPMVPGGELGWEAMAGPTPYPYSIQFYRNLVFHDPNWDHRQRPVNFDSDVDRADAPENLVINANNPDVSGFLRRGGKLLLLGGWNDHTLGPGSNVDYYKSIVSKVGERTARDSVRLFMVPGMDHCLAESYPTAPTVDLDVVRLLKQWKTSGKAPDRVVVRVTPKDETARDRLVCAYPKTARYNGSGDVGDPANFSCR